MGESKTHETEISLGEEKEIVGDVTTQIGDLEEWSFNYSDESGEYTGEITVERRRHSDGEYYTLKIASGRVSTQVTLGELEDALEFSEWLTDSIEQLC